MTTELQSSPPDLRVIVGGLEEWKEPKVYLYYSSVLATYSTYVDSMLSSPMIESQSKEIHFPEIEPLIWDMMIQFVTDPEAIRWMSIKDVLLVAQFYDKYGFMGGLGCCDCIARAYFDKNIEFITNNDHGECDIHECVEVILAADNCNLPRSKTKGIEYFNQVLNSSDDFKDLCIDEFAIEKLVPILVKEKDKLIDQSSYLWPDDVIRNSLFPILYVKSMQLKYASDELNFALQRIEALRNERPQRFN
jgi:hypothetical protein